MAVVGCGGRGSGAAVQALTADADVTLVAMADAFQDRIDQSLVGIQEHFEGEKTIAVKKESQFTGFDAYKKAIDMADVVILATPPGFRPQHSNTLYSKENMCLWKSRVRQMLMVFAKCSRLPKWPSLKKTKCSGWSATTL